MHSFSGHLSVRAAVRQDGRSALVHQSFRAPFHLSKPYWDPDGKVLVLQVVNPTAGILSGDRLSSHIAVASGAALLVSTPSASRVFTMREGRAEHVQTFTVAPGGWLEVLPEPLVPHRGSTFRQVTQVDVAPGGAVFFVDLLMPGRVGHGEAWEWRELTLLLEVRHAGALTLRERFAYPAALARAMAERSGCGPTACFANAVLLAPDASEIPPWRDDVAALHRDGTWVGSSALRGGGWTIKVIAPDMIRLRETLSQIRVRLSDYYPSLKVQVRKL